MSKVRRKMEQKGVKFGTQQKFCRVAKISQHAEFRRLQNFATCKISQVANFRNLQNFAGCKFLQPAPMLILTHLDQIFVTFS